MFYIVFTEYDKVKKPSGGVYAPAPVCRYVGRVKSAALEAFKDHVDFAFSTAAPYPGRTYFVGFDSDLDFIKVFEEKGITSLDDIKWKDISLFKNNLDVAVCSHVLRHSCHKFIKSIVVTKCNNCNADTILHKNAYGQYLCADCWNNYLTTVNGQVEYVIGLATGEYKITAFSEKDRKWIAEAWNTYKANLGKTEEELLTIETAAKEAGLVFELPEE